MSVTPSEFILGRRRHLSGEAAWEAFAMLGGDAFASNHGGWHRRNCPAHTSRSGSSLVFKLDETGGTPTLVVHDFAGCTPADVLAAVGIDTEGLDLAEPTLDEWLTAGARRPGTFQPFEDPAITVTDWRAERALALFADKRQFDVEVLRRCGVTIVEHDEGRWSPLRARFPFIVDGQLVGAWDRQIADTEPGGRRWVMSGGIPVPFGWDAALDVGRRSGHVYVVEGPTDAVALLHALPGAAVLGVGAGRSMWRPWWGQELWGLTAWVIADNDTGGEMTRRVAHAVLDPHAWEVVDVRIPPAHNDLDDWRRAAGPAFTSDLVEAIQRAAVAPRRRP